MLPTKGYFQDIDCPYYDTSCGRPYCHFKHKKKQQETGSNFCEETEVPTYKPTPKNQLANNRAHIPISYVPDLAFRPERSVRNIQKITQYKPTYKPTPLSKLSVIKQDGPSSVKELDETVESNTNEEDSVHTTKNAASESEYCPAFNQDISSNYTPTNIDEPLENESEQEYKPAGETSTYEYKPSSNIEGADKGERAEHESEHEYRPAGESPLVEYKPSSNIGNVDNQSDMHYQPTGDFSEIYNPTPQIDKKYLESTIDFEDLNNEFDMIDEIINTTDEHENAEDPKSEKNTERPEQVCLDQTNTSDTKTKDKVKVGKITTERDDKHSRKHDTKKTKPTENHQSKSKSEKSKHESKHGKSDNQKTKSINLVEEVKRETAKPKSKGSPPEKSDKTKTKAVSEHSSKHQEPKTKHGSSSSSRSTSSHKNKHKSHDRDKEKPKETKHSGKEGEKSNQTKHSSKEAEKTHQTKHSSKESDKNHQTKHSSKESEKTHRSKSSSKEKTSDKKHENKRLKSDEDNSRKKKKLDSVDCDSETLKEDSCSGAEDSYLNFDNFDFQIDSEDDETMQECYRIFNEYKPPQMDTKPTLEETVQEKPNPEVAFGKKRIAHTNAEKFVTSGKYNPAPVKLTPNAAQVMTNRFKAIRAAHANDEQSNIMQEVKNMSLKRPAPPPALAAAVKNYKVQKTMKDAQLHRSPATSSLVDDIISGTNKTNSAIAKFNQRKIAPVSNVYSLQQAKQRIQEMRQKSAETNTKTPAQTAKTSKRVAHVPEFSLVDIPDVLQADKSKLPVNVRTRFLTMIADECGKLYMSKEDAYTRALNEEFACYEKCKVLTTYKNSAMLAVSRIRKELQERSKQGLGLLDSLEDPSKDKGSELKGKRFHDNVIKYLMREEDLELHGYPKESKTPGKAMITNKREVPSINLDEFQRKCSRCSKIYVVDEDGFAFYEEECLYHPLKKRTLRGEQTYLCCKSNDDTGCCTSHTHVSDCRDSSELEGYQTTMRPNSECDPRSEAVYALDCEMCYTTKGLELTRVTIVDSECKTVYDTLVKPLNPIIDYNTRFSGITKDQMDRTSTSILQVQANILHLCNSETILVGHSLESDMKALKIIHRNIIDTAILFPHRLGLPHKRALRALASEYLKKIIQNDISGHDSAEDSITCMELIKWKLREDLKVRGIKC